MVIKTRKATEEETTLYMETIANAVIHIRENNIIGMEAVKFREDCARKIQLMRDPILDCILWHPTPKQVFESWCAENGVDDAYKEFANKVWFGAMATFSAPQFEENLRLEIEEATKKLSTMSSQERMEEKAKRSIAFREKVEEVIQRLKSQS